MSIVISGSNGVSGGRLSDSGIQPAMPPSFANGTLGAPAFASGLYYVETGYTTNSYGAAGAVTLQPNATYMIYVHSYEGGTYNVDMDYIYDVTTTASSMTITGRMTPSSSNSITSSGLVLTFTHGANQFGFCLLAYRKG